MNFNLGDRIQIDNQLCTIKFIGEIDRWPGILTYGVEWDMPSRGKHSGSVDNKTYFRTTMRGAGSFIKESKVIQKVGTKKTKTFWDCLLYKYRVSSECYDKIYFGLKKIEAFGFEKLDIKNKDFKSMNTISLNNQGINKLMLDDPLDEIKQEFKSIKNNCQNIQNLDLGFNCFSSINDLCKLLSCLPSLTDLNLSGNRFLLNMNDLEISKTSNFKFNQIKSLYLTSCNLSESPDIIKFFLNLCPNLRLLDLSFNNLSDEDIINLELPNSTEKLLLAHNNLEALPKFTGIQYLDLSHNNLSDFAFENLVYREDTLYELDLSYNDIRKWSAIDRINTHMKSLRFIKLLNNKLFEVDKAVVTEQDNIFYELIARLEWTTKIDDSAINTDLRRTAELFFISNVLTGKTEYSKESSRWKYLKTLHNIDESKFSTVGNSSSPSLKEMILTLNIVDEINDQKLVIKASSNWDMLSLKGAIARRINSNIFEISLCKHNRDEVQQKLDNNFFLLKDYFIVDQDVLYVSK